jgi:Domain of unknown function (DUF397)
MACDQGVPIEWKTSSKSNGGNCVEVAFHNGMVLIRDSKNREGGTISVPSAEWRKFLVDVKRE